MFLRIASLGTIAATLSASCLAILSTSAHAFPTFAPQNCAGCHGNPTLTTTPGNGGFLKFGNAGNTLVGLVSSGQFSITNATDTSAQALPGGGFTGSFAGAGAGTKFAPSTALPITGTLGGDGLGYLTPGMSDTRTYTYAPTVRGADTTTLSFTPTNGFNPAPTVTITLQGQGVAPVVNLDTTQTNAGNVRLGTTGSAQVTVKNVGDGNLSGLGATSNLHGTVGALAGAFAGSGGSFNLQDAGAQAFAYSFTPASHGTIGSTLNVTTSNGSTDGQNHAQGPTPVTLSGTGVGPVYGASTAPGGTLSFSDLVTSNVLSISNITSDADLGSLTALTLISAQISGIDGSMFSLLNFAPGTQLAKGGTFDLEVDFAPSGAPGTHSALLTLFTDEGAALGASGDEFSYILTAAATLPAVPEPGSLQLILAGLVATGVLLRRRRKVPS